MAKLVPFVVSACLGLLVAAISAVWDLEGWVVYVVGAALAVLLVGICAPLALGSKDTRARAPVSMPV